MRNTGGDSGIENFLLAATRFMPRGPRIFGRQMAVNYPQLLEKMKEAEGSSRIPSESTRNTSPAPASPEESTSSEVPKFDVWAERHYSSWENLLQSELTINGQLVDVFSSDRTAAFVTI